ncbi:DHH family phosphoesterase [bacterium]|nr:DHH family phosphoesterase [bacterium]
MGATEKTTTDEAPEVPRGRLAELLRAVDRRKTLLILAHNNPDPDAIAAAFGLRHIIRQTSGIRCRLAYGGLIGRAENIAMVKLLRIPIHKLSPGQVARYKQVALVDCSGGPNTQAQNLKNVRVIVDHHKARRPRGVKGSISGVFADIRPEYGATSSIITEYIRENNIPINARIATALYYGIKTDVSDTGRDSSDADIKMMQFLFGAMSLRWLWRIERAPIPREYIAHYSDSVRNARIVQDLVMSDLGAVAAPESVAEMSDFLLKVKGARWSLCLGDKKGVLYFSIRTSHRGRQLGRIAARLAGKKGSGGGHDKSAGGQITLDGLPDTAVIQLRNDLMTRFGKSIGRDAANAAWLVSRPADAAADGVVVAEVD